MNRYSFSTFLTDDANREAERVCRAVAALEPAGPQPVLLLGEEGCGKTHLLYAVVNLVRASGARASLAFVNASEFPERARAVVHHPEVVRRAEQAILFVDQLERFAEGLDDLEALVRIFLDCGHRVLFASNTHPQRITHLPDSLRALAVQGQTVPIGPLTPESRAAIAARAHAAAEVRRLQEELARTVRAKPDPDAANAGERIAALEKALNDERERAQGLEQTVAQLREPAAAADNAPAPGPEEDAAVAEMGRALEAAERLLEDFDTRYQQLEALERAQQQEIEQLRALREPAGAPDSDALAQAEHVRGELEAMREQLARAEAERDTALADAEAERDAYAQRMEERETESAGLRLELEEARAEADRLRAEIDRKRNESAETRTGLESARTELAEARDHLERARLARTELEQLLQDSETALAEAQQDLQQLRQDAAAEVAQAHAQAGELEGQVARLQTELDLVRQHREADDTRLNAVRRHLRFHADALSELAGDAAPAADPQLLLPDAGAPSGPGFFEDAYADAPAGAEETEAQRWRRLSTPPPEPESSPQSPAGDPHDAGPHDADPPGDTSWRAGA